MNGRLEANPGSGRFWGTGRPRVRGGPAAAPCRSPSPLLDLLRVAGLRVRTNRHREEAREAVAPSCPPSSLLQGPRETTRRRGAPPGVSSGAEKVLVREGLGQKSLCPGGVSHKREACLRVGFHGRSGSPHPFPWQVCYLGGACSSCQLIGKPGQGALRCHHEPPLSGEQICVTTKPRLKDTFQR